MPYLTPVWLLAVSLALALLAHRLGSRITLAVALMSFATFMSADVTFSFFLPFSRVPLHGTGWRFLGCAAVLILWTAAQVRFLPHRRELVAFQEGFAVHLVGVGALLLTLPGYFDRPLPASLFVQGMAVLCACVLLVAGIGWHRKQRTLLLAALAYALAGAWRLQFRFLDDTLTLVSSSVVSLFVAIVLFRWIRHRPGVTG